MHKYIQFHRCVFVYIALTFYFGNHFKKYTFLELFLRSKKVVFAVCEAAAQNGGRYVACGTYNVRQGRVGDGEVQGRCGRNGQEVYIA